MPTTKNILATLAYFDMFDYPLTIGEIHWYLGIKTDRDDLAIAILRAVNNSRIFKYGQYYSLKNDPQLVAKRHWTHKNSEVQLAEAKHIAGLLIKLPYVKGIAISGPMFKTFADYPQNIDFKIIVAKDRLWIAYLILWCFQKTHFILRFPGLYRFDQFVDESRLQSIEKNLYTATEIENLIPIEGDIVFEQFFSDNSWTRSFFPNKTLRLSTASAPKKFPLKGFIEFCLNNSFGHILDDLIMKFRIKGWRLSPLSKWKGHINKSFVAGKHYLILNRDDLQTHILTRYREKLKFIADNKEDKLAQ